jgi:AraC-like DNA-binding protein
MALSTDYTRIPYETSIPVRVYENRENKNYPLHWHSAVEIIMPLKREYQVRLLKESHRLREQDILIIPSCEPHGITVPPAAEDGRRIILLFEPALFYSIPGLSESMSVMYPPKLLSPENTPEIYETVRSILLAIYGEFLRADALKESAIYARIIDLCVAMIRYYGGNGVPGTAPVDRHRHIAKLNAVFEYIEKHVSEELTLDNVAEIAHFSKYHFERIFKKYTNSSFHQYLKYLRVMKAAALLLNPNMAITEVAQEAGFESIATFNRAFKEIESCTPSEYIKRPSVGGGRAGGGGGGAAGGGGGAGGAAAAAAAAAAYGRTPAVGQQS